MEQFCSNCRAVLVGSTPADWCPACGGALVGRPALVESKLPGLPPAEVDHRGVVLPRRYPVGGIITPQ